MTLVFGLRGEVFLLAKGGPARFRSCDEESVGEVAQCVLSGAESFETLYSARLR